MRACGFSAILLLMLASPAGAQTYSITFPAAPPANETVQQRAERYEQWRAANADIDVRIAEYTASAVQQSVLSMIPPDQLRERVRAEPRFAEIIARSAQLTPAQREEAASISATALQLWQQEQIAAAALLYASALALDPGNAAAAYHLGEIRMRSGQAADARELFLRTIAVSPLNSAEYAQAAVAFYNQSNLIDGPNRPPLLWDCAMCPELSVIPSGVLGHGAQGRAVIERPFALGRFEVTYDEWAACVTGGGCRSNTLPRQAPNGGRGRRPVVDVTWSDAQEYVTWLSTTTGKRYFIPNHGQWEFAARAGTTGAFYWANEASPNMANLGGLNPTTGQVGSLTGGRDQWASLAPVGQFPPNGFGLYDVVGNVAEWVDGCAQPGADGVCAEHISRGGSWWSPEASSAIDSIQQFLQPSSVGNPSRAAYFNIGFRVAREL
ncbi:MAG: SUMF1/EgtB/PvdO family nonheme iron enzyme [Hyphomonadaceae bacterium]